MPGQYPISVVILAKNEEINILRSIESVRACNDIVVVDDGSTDATRSLAEDAGARVVEHRFESFAKQRNWALKNAQLKNDWVLMLDADEAATPAFLEELNRALKDVREEDAAFRTCRKTFLGEKWLRYSDEFPCWIMRVVHRDRAAFEDSGHGEVPIPRVNGQMLTLTEPFLHYPFSHGINNWVVRHVRYAEREARLELTQSSKIKIREMLSWNSSVRRRAFRNLSRLLPARPVLRFLYNYILRGGFLDGREGFIFSLLKAIYEAMIVVKRWELAWRHGYDQRPEHQVRQVQVASQTQ